jgi:signal transduction histidine kinase
LVELHKGTIVVKSKLDEGTRFEITLPRGHSHLEPSQKVESQNIPLHSARRDVSQLTPMELDTTEKPISIESEIDNTEKTQKILLVEDDGMLEHT